MIKLPNPMPFVRKQKYLWILDNGHGKETPGKRSPVLPDKRQLFEYEFNRSIVNRIIKYLKDSGVAFHKLVPEVTDVPLGERVKRANELRTDLKKALVSVHANAAGSDGWVHASGYEVFTTRAYDASDRVANIFFREMHAAIPEFNLRADLSDGDSDKEADFFILKGVHFAPAILTENGFMTDPDEARRLLNDGFRERIAQAHANAIIKIEAEED